MWGHRLAVPVLFSAVLLVSPVVLAGSAENPEIEDPSGDAVHYEFKNEEPSLDVTKVWFTWEGGTLQVHLLVDDVGTFGSEGTQDPSDAGTRYDVYWTMDGEDYVARVGFCTPLPGADCQIPSGEPVFLAGQAMRIERQGLWEPGTDIHGNLTEQAGGVAEAGSPAHLRVDVDPAAVGDPGPGSVLEAPGFATYVDHHNPGSGTRDGPNNHHPGHVDGNDEAGADYRIQDTSSGSTGSESEASGADDEGSMVPAVGPAGLAAVLAALATATRHRSGR